MLKAWNMRLTRDQVYGRYYFPEAWEMREMKSIEKFLELQDPREIPWFMVRAVLTLQFIMVW